MAYVEIGMWEVLEVLRRVHRGESQAAIERVTGRTRKTVRRYTTLALELGWDPEGAEPDEALACAVVQRLRPVAAQSSPGASEAQLASHREQIRRWLHPDDERRGLQLSKVHQLLTRRGVGVPYSSLHRYAVAHCGFREHRRGVRCGWPRRGPARWRRSTSEGLDWCGTPRARGGECTTRCL